MEIDTSDEAMVERLEKIDEIAAKYPITFAEYCHKNYGIRYSISEQKSAGRISISLRKMIPFKSLICFGQLQERFGEATENMLTALMAYDKLLEEKEIRNAYIW